jgi:hypothetical protein
MNPRSVVCSVGDDRDDCPVDAANDADGDGVCGDVDPCPLDNPDDTDGDGVCDSADQCPESDDTLDADGNGTPDCWEPPPAPQPTGGCCAPGVFPMVGLFTPIVLLGRSSPSRWFEDTAQSPVAPAGGAAAWQAAKDKLTTCAARRD